MVSSMREVAHWDDAPSETTDLGTIAATEHWLSGAVGSRRLGVSRNEIPPGRASTPLHAEDEEVFYVLAGSGWSVQEDGCFAIGAGDVVAYTAWEPAHTVVAGDDGIDYIALGTTDTANSGVRFPRIDKVRLAGHLLSGDHTHQWELESKLPRIELADPPADRPSTIRHTSEAPAREFPGATARWLTKDLGLHGIALNLAELGPGAEAAPRHCHSHEEEHPLRAGSVVGRPPGTGVAHAFRAGPGGMTLLMFSDKHPGDMTFYPDWGKVTLRGLGVTFRPEIVPWGPPG